MSSRFSIYSFISPQISSSYESFFAKKDDFPEFAGFERLCNVTVRRVKPSSPIAPLDLKHVTLRGGKKTDKVVKVPTNDRNEEKSNKNVTCRKKRAEKTSAMKDLSTSKNVTRRNKHVKKSGSPKHSATSKHVTTRRKPASKTAKSPTSKHVTLRKKHDKTSKSTKTSSASKADQSKKHVSGNVTHRKRRIPKASKVVNSESSDSFASTDSVSGTRIRKDVVYKFFAGLTDMPEPVSTTDESCVSGSDEEVYDWSDDC